MVNSIADAIALLTGQVTEIKQAGQTLEQALKPEQVPAPTPEPTMTAKARGWLSDVTIIAGTSVPNAALATVAALLIVWAFTRLVRKG